MCSTLLKLLLIGLVGCLVLVKAQEEPHAEDEPDPEDDHEEEEEGSQWSYDGDHGPEHWGDMYGSCAEQRQSPIDIQTDTVVPAEFHKLSLKYYFSTPKEMTVLNTGHTVQLELEMSQMPWMTGGGYLGDYEFKQIQFHWGSDADQGSEHTIDGRRSPLEMHIVHLNRKYDSIETVLEQQYVDGLAVLGVMFEVVDDENDDLDSFLETLEKIPEPGDEAEIEDVFPIGKLLPTDLNDFYFYSGSLTTPGCSEVVSWTVFSDKVPISSSQLARFRALREDTSHRMEDNFRPTQAHNGRNVYHRSVLHEVPIALASKSEDSHGAHHWTYAGSEGPQNWGKMFDTCDGQHQSPIDIDTNEVIKSEMDPLRFRNYFHRPEKMSITNNGHTAQLEATMKDMPQVEGGALQDEYEFLQLHFHWGAESDKGSEHTVDGKSAPLEMHIVHYNSKYGSAADVIENKPVDGLAVIGVMFEVSEEDNHALDTLVNALDRIKAPSNKTEIADVFSIGSLLPHDYSKFYSYSGSLTTPGCYQIVSWTVLSEKVPISNDQLEYFRNLETSHEHKLVNNYRPTQPINGRSVLVRYTAEMADHDDDDEDSHGKHHWEYTGSGGPQNWAAMFDTCGGQHQSPIDIDTNEAIKAEMDPLKLRNYFEQPAKLTIHNNGHTAQLEAEMMKKPQIMGGALQDNYEFLQLHFHWGAESDVGSEHTVNGKSSPLEMHIVHFSTKYPSAGDVIRTKPVDGLAVLGVMFEVSEEDNPAWDNLIKALDHITVPGNKTEIKDVFSIGSLLPHDYSQFYSYTGSLTTPGCYEIVSWTVLHDRVPISNAQLEHFRDLETGHDHKLVNNYRPTQPHNGRSVLVQHVPAMMAGAQTVSATVFLSLLMLLVVKLF